MRTLFRLSLLCTLAILATATPCAADPSARPDNESPIYASPPADPLTQLDFVGAPADLPDAPPLPALDGEGNLTATPEPATAAFLAAGSLVLIGLELRRRVRRRKRPAEVRVR